MENRKLQEYLTRLKTQEKFLEQKLSERDEAGSHYLRKEIKALKWIIRFAEDNELEASEHLYYYVIEEGKKRNEQS